jgi:hypothetical protein
MVWLDSVRLNADFRRFSVAIGRQKDGFLGRGAPSGAPKAPDRTQFVGLNAVFCPYSGITFTVFGEISATTGNLQIRLPFARGFRRLSVDRLEGHVLRRNLLGRLLVSDHPGKRPLFERLNCFPLFCPIIEMPPCSCGFLSW